MTSIGLGSEADERIVRRRRLKAILLPVEHGGWGLTLEPVLAGLIAAFSIPGLAIGLMIVTAFLSRQPLRIAMRPGGNPERLRIAAIALAIQSLVLILLLATVVRAGALDSLLVLAAGTPLALFLLWRDRLRRSRDLVAELSAALFMSLGAIAIVLAGGKPILVAAALGALVAARSAGAILHVRERVQARRGLEASRAVPIVAHVLALGGAILAVVAGPANLLAPMAFALLLWRTVVPPNFDTAAKLGWSEVKFGLTSLVLLGLSMQ